MICLQGTLPLWQKKIEVADLVHTHHLLNKAAIRSNMFAMEDLVAWESLKTAKNFRDGPKKGTGKTNLSWPSTLKVFLEVTLSHVNIIKHLQ